MEAGVRSGELLTRPVLLGPGSLQLSLATAAGGMALVELQQLNGTPIPGYALSDCLP